MIHLKPVTLKNIEAVIALKLREEQEGFVLSNVISIAQAYVQPECIPLAIYNDDTIVGFVMYCVDRDDDQYWVYRIMIDEKFQRKGFAREAMVQLLKKIKSDSSRNKIFIGVDADNIAATALYLSLDFVFDGRTFGKERIMMLAYST